MQFLINFNYLIINYYYSANSPQFISTIPQQSLPITPISLTHKQPSPPIPSPPFTILPTFPSQLI